MGGLRKKMPLAWGMMLIGTLAITGVGIPGTYIGFAGFFSKDAVLEEAFLSGSLFSNYAFWCGILAAALTSYYSWRLMLMTFHGPTRADPHAYDHAHDAPKSMTIPLYTLSIGAVLAGVVFYSSFIGGLGETNKKFWGESIYRVEHHEPFDEVLYSDHGHDEEHIVGYGDMASSSEKGGEDKHHDDAHGHSLHPPDWVLWAPFFASLLGLVLALIFYGLFPNIPRKMGKRSGPMHAFLSNKWYFDELYNFVFVKGAKALGDLFWKIGDQFLIDGGGPNGLTKVANLSAKGLSRIHTGYVFHYAFIILIAVVVFGGVALIRQLGAQ
jgi:NADH-quinone oxidoreductase subunit L